MAFNIEIVVARTAFLITTDPGAAVLQAEQGAERKLITDDILDQFRRHIKAEYTVDDGDLTQTSWLQIHPCHLPPQHG